MNLLALDTSTEYCSVALLSGGEVRQRLERAGQRHSALLLPMADELLAEAGLSPAQLGGIAVTLGPGSFTGVRIAIAVAQGIALGAGLPVAAVGTLEALAWGCGESAVVACTDARMGEVYCAAFRRTPGGLEEAFAPCVAAPANVPELPGGSWTGTGSGFAVHGPALAERWGVHLARTLPGAYPEARHALSLASARHPAGFSGSVEALLPLYVRDKVASTMAER